MNKNNSNPYASPRSADARLNSDKLVNEKSLLVFAHVICIITAVSFGAASFTYSKSGDFLLLGAVGIVFGLFWSRIVVPTQVAVGAATLGVLGIPIAFAFC